MLVGAAAAGHDVDVVLDVLSRPDDDLADLLALVADLCDSPSAGITIFNGDHVHVPVAHGVQPVVTPASESFCWHTRGTQGLFYVEDASRDPRFAELIAGDGPFAKARFYASAPLHAPDGRVIGRLCVIDSSPKEMTSLQQRTLATMAVSASQLLELRLVREARALPLTPESSQAAATVMTQLAAELSHDLRVPLTSIVATVELLAEELADHEDRAVAALLHRATRSADRMLRMLDQHMEFGVTDEAPDAVPVDLGQVVEQLVLDSAALLEPAGAVVQFRELPVVHADVDDMYSVLQNLITNAVKFARPDVPPWVQISARPSGERWRVSVLDNGVGIPEDRRVDVFSLFSRVGDQVEGHGIGLATVARIVKAHGGSAGIEPAPGAGTEIWFELPRA
ncbi:MAG: hypothetical protein JWL64_914 [Frankiales bacterium]|nr:hypothetical protein [Frankiales bacterium]